MLILSIVTFSLSSFVVSLFGRDLLILRICDFQSKFELSRSLFGCDLSQYCVFQLAGSKMSVFVFFLY